MGFNIERIFVLFDSSALPYILKIQTFPLSRLIFGTWQIILSRKPDNLYYNSEGNIKLNICSVLNFSQIYAENVLAKVCILTVLNN